MSEPTAGKTNSELNPVWEELADMIDSLPDEQRQRLQGAISTFIHDVRGALGIIYSAEELLRRVSASNSADLELLDMIRNSDRKAMDLLADMSTSLGREHVPKKGSGAAGGNTGLESV